MEVSDQLRDMAVVLLVPSVLPITRHTIERCLVSVARFPYTPSVYQTDEIDYRWKDIINQSIRPYLVLFIIVTVSLLILS